MPRAVGSLGRRHGLPLLLAGAALIAAYLPARRASRLNPSAVLGSE